MRRFRNIIIENVEYKWLFRYEDYDDTKFPYLLIVKKCIPEETLRIKFWITEHFFIKQRFTCNFSGKDGCNQSESTLLYFANNTIL